MSKVVIFSLLLAAVVVCVDGAAAVPTAIAEAAEEIGEPTSYDSNPEGRSFIRVKRYERTAGERVGTYASSTGAGAALGSFAGPLGAVAGAAAGFVAAVVIDLTRD